MCKASLHNPSREKNILTVEEHLDCCVNVSRSLWLIFAGCQLDLQDRRNIEALSELADLIADHASAARFSLVMSEITPES